MSCDSDMSDDGGGTSFATRTTRKQSQNDTSALEEANRQALASVAELNKSTRDLGFVLSLIPLAAMAGALSALVFRTGDTGSASSTANTRQSSSGDDMQDGAASYDHGSVCTAPEGIFSAPVCRVEFPQDATKDEILSIVEEALTKEEEAEGASGRLVEVRQTR